MRGFLLFLRPQHAVAKRNGTVRILWIHFDQSSERIVFPPASRWRAEIVAGIKARQDFISWAELIIKLQICERDDTQGRTG